jgi:hypothetical protein
VVLRRTVTTAGGAAAVLGAGGYMLTRPDYTAAAASLRQPRESDGPTDFGYLVHYASLAANSHNTQPWTFRQTASGAAIAPDLARATPVVDPDNHHLFVSLGCAAENLMLAASARGQTSALRFAPDSDGRVEIDLGTTRAVHDPLFDATPARQCTRSDYDGRAVSASDLALLQTAARMDGCELILIPERDRINQVAELILAANALQIADPAFTSELRSWIRFNPRSAIATGDGLYSACSGNPTLPSWLGALVFDMAFTPASENDRARQQLTSSAGLAVFVSDKDDKAHWVQAGRSYQRFALQATALGIRHAFLNQPVEVAQFRPELARLAGVGARRPDLVVRFGYAPPMPYSLRRPIAEVIAQA